MQCTPAILDKIIEIVCEANAISVEELLKKEWHTKRRGNSRLCPRKVSTAKQEICYLAVRNKISLRTVAMKILYEGKGTVSKNAKKIKEEIRLNADSRQKIENAENELLKMEKAPAVTEVNLSQ